MLSSRDLMWIAVDSINGQLRWYCVLLIPMIEAFPTLQGFEAASHASRKKAKSSERSTWLLYLRRHETSPVHAFLGLDQSLCIDE